MVKYKYPFRDYVNEIKPRVAGAYVSNDIENLRPSFVLGSKNIIDVVGLGIWNLAIEHYNDVDNYNLEAEEREKFIRLNRLVSLIQDAMINFVYYHHFIWLIMKINDQGVIINKSQDTTTAYKYLTDEGQGKLLECGWMFINELIEFLNSEKTFFTFFKTGTNYKRGDIVYLNQKFYEYKEDHLSVENIDDEIIFLTEITDNEQIIFKEWTLCDEYQKANEIFFNYKEFNKYFNIDNSAYFFIKSRDIINEVISDDVEPRYELFEEFKEAAKNGNLTKEQIVLKEKIIRVIVYKTISTAIERFDFYELPKNLRDSYNNEMNMMKGRKNSTEENIRIKLSNSILRKANEYILNLESYLQTQKIVQKSKIVEKECLKTVFIDNEKNHRFEDDSFVFVF